MKYPSLGNALAIIKKGQSDESNILNIEDTGFAGYIHELVARKKVLMNSPDKISTILTSIPRNTCSGEKCILTDNRDFFIIHILECSDETSGVKYCESLVKHLNDCYRCFKEYSKVMREFYYQTESSHHIKTN